MTTNQLRAVRLARAMSEGRIDAAGLSDDDWSLLLLAAGLNQTAAAPAVVARRVVDAAWGRSGYFGAWGLSPAAVSRADGGAASISRPLPVYSTRRPAMPRNRAAPAVA